jgi:hypothetical protein
LVRNSGFVARNSLCIIKYSEWLWPEQPGFDSLQNRGLFISPLHPNRVWCCLLSAVSAGIKRLECGTDHLLPSRAKIKNACSFTSAALSSWRDDE